MGKNELVSYDDMIEKELAASGAYVAPPSSNKISTKGKKFTLPDGRSEPGPMTVVVLDFTQFNVLYPGSYQAGNPQQPVCWALGKELSALVPSDNAPEVQAASCGSCPKNEFGSALVGKGKACKNQKRLIIVPVDATEKTEPMTIYVSPTGIKHWESYYRELTQRHGLLPVQAITEIAFNPNEAFPTLQFEFMGPHDALPTMMKLREKAQDMVNKEPEVTPKAA